MRLRRWYAPTCASLMPLSSASSLLGTSCCPSFCSESSGTVRLSTGLDVGLVPWADLELAQPVTCAAVPSLQFAPRARVRTRAGHDRSVFSASSAAASSSFSAASSSSFSSRASYLCSSTSSASCPASPPSAAIRCCFCCCCLSSSFTSFHSSSSCIIIILKIRTFSLWQLDMSWHVLFMIPSNLFVAQYIF